MTPIFITKAPLGEEGRGRRGRPDQGLALFMTEVLRKGSWLWWLSLRNVSRGGGGAAEDLMVEGVGGLQS